MAEILNLGYIAWKNDLAWTESQKGSQWEKAIQGENENFTSSLKGLSIKPIEKDLKSADISHPWNYKGFTIRRSHFSPNQTWLYKGLKQICWDADIDSSETYLAAAVQDPKGFERFSVEIFQIQKGQISKVKSIQGCGPQVAFYKDELIYLESSKALRYDSVRAYNPKTGKDTLLYSLKDPKENLELKRAEDGSVYVIVDDFVMKRVGFIKKRVGILWKGKGKDIFVVSNETLILNQKSPIKDTILESMSKKAQWLVTRSKGIRTLWNTSKDEPESMITVWGEINFDARDVTRLYITDLRYEPYIVDTTSWTLSNPEAYPFPITHYLHPAPSFLVYPEGPVKGLLVTAYGAYGSPTHVGSLVERWHPLLLRGWAVASVCVPGSGDHDIEWKEAGQRLNRKVAIDSLRDAVQNLQEELSISPKKTCLYGRSAGGLLVISTATLYPSLLGALYVESPYVDVLRTISNEKLPLTDLETREFGIGTNPVDILATQSWSPMEHTPADGIPELFVVARSDSADLEVFPYEVLKWIWRVRGLNTKTKQKKLLYIDNGQGHFATGFKSRAEDLALLDRWLNSPDGIPDKKSAVRRKNRSTKYKMALSRKNKKNMTRKNKKNNAPMMGGRRRRGSRKSTRRGRKGSRRH